MSWWKKAVVYQIYPRSFKDSNDDGIGDIKGIIESLDYIKYLGANVIWLCPVYESPDKDNGYDISNYYKISEKFGSMKDMEQLIEKASEKGIYIMMDIVANHTSDQHMWFKKALESKENPYRSYYVFKENEGAVPSDLQSIFLDSAWTYHQETDAYYLHMFAKEQPDLNWHHPKVREEIYEIINFWIDKGIKGFRFDVIDLIAKEIDQNIIGDGPKLHTYIKEMTQQTFKNRDLITVGETWGATVEKAKQYSNIDQSEFSMIFNFEHILLDQIEHKEKWDLKPLDLKALKKVFNTQQQGLYGCGWNALFLNNHDLPRIVSRWGNDQEPYRVYAAKMLATLLHFMQGTPYIYQGEELGMTNVKFEDLAMYKDIEIKQMIKDRLEKGYVLEDIRKSIETKGRDNARTPFHWNTSKHAGFTNGTPWIDVNPNYQWISVAAQQSDEKSVLWFYKKLIDLRKQSIYSDLIEQGTFDLIYPEHESLFAYQRKYKDDILSVYCNFYDQEIKIDHYEKYDKVILQNYEDVKIKDGLTLRPYESVVLFSKNLGYNKNR